MKILTPIMSVADIDILNPQLYNTEFFCGYLPQWWINEYNDAQDTEGNLATPINNRNGRNSNVTTFEELAEIVKKSKEYNTDVFLVLNAKYYPNYVYGSISKYIEEVLEAGITRMIVSDIGMINFLSINYPTVKVSVSCLNQVTNKYSVEFYKSFVNVDRIVFPRHMSSQEIASIAMEVNGLEYEYFIFSNKCLYDDGYCRGVHEFTPICKDLFYSDFYTNNGGKIETVERRKLAYLEHEFADWTRSELICEGSDFCTPNFACCACSLVKLSQISSITSVKLSIRGHNIQERLRQVRMANEVISETGKGATIRDIKQIISRSYGKESLCEDGTSCMMI